MNDDAHCHEKLCAPDQTDLCACPCLQCDLAYFYRNMRRALKFRPDDKTFTPAQAEALNKSEDFFLPVRGKTEHAVMLDDANFFSSVSCSDEDQRDK